MERNAEQTSLYQAVLYSGEDAAETDKSCENEEDETLFALSAKPQPVEGQTRQKTRESFSINAFPRHETLDRDLAKNFDDYGRSPLHRAVLWYMYEHCVNYDDMSQRLGLDSSPKSTNIVKKLLERGCSVNAQDKHGNTPLMMASLIQNPLLTKYFQDMLLEYGADATKCNNSNVTCLHLAAMQGRLHDVKTYYNRGCDVTTRSSGMWMSEKYYQGTCLHFAAKSGHANVVWYLLETAGASSFLPSSPIIKKVQHVLNRIRAYSGAYRQVSRKMQRLFNILLKLIKDIAQPQ